MINPKSDGLGITAITEVPKLIFSIHDNIYISFTIVHMVYCGSWLSDSATK